MKKILFDIVKDSIRSIDIEEIQKTCKDFVDTIQKVPTPINDFVNSSHEDCFVTPSRIKVENSSQNEILYKIDVFGFEKNEIKVKVKNDILVVTGIKKTKTGLFPEGFNVEIPMLNFKLNGRIVYNNNILLIPTIKVAPTTSEDLEIH